MAFRSSKELKSLLIPISLSTISGVMSKLSLLRDIITLSNSEVKRLRSDPTASAIICFALGSIATFFLFRYS